MKPGMPQSQRLKETLKSVLESVSASLKAPVAKTDVEIDLRSQYIRTQEVRFRKRTSFHISQSSPIRWLQATGSLTSSGTLTTTSYA